VSCWRPFYVHNFPIILFYFYTIVAVFVVGIQFLCSFMLSFLGFILYVIKNQSKTYTHSPALFREYLEILEGIARSVVFIENHSLCLQRQAPEALKH
jgi:hypothetical protein